MTDASLQPVAMAIWMKAGAPHATDVFAWALGSYPSHVITACLPKRTWPI